MGATALFCGMERQPIGVLRPRGERNLSASASRIEKLALDVERSESVRAVKRLQIAQAHYLLYGLWDEAADLYSCEAEIVSGRSLARGREAIRAWLIERFGYGQAAPAARALRLQLILAPIVTLSSDGRSAKGRWSELSATGIFGERADWFGGIQENVYVREDGVWKIHRIGDFPHFAGSYEDGWRSLTPDLPVIPYHFIPSMAGRPIPDIPGGTERPAVYNDAQAAMLLSTCEQRIAALNDEDDIRNLQNAYGYYCDRKMWDDVVDLFTSDAVFEIAGEKIKVRAALEVQGPAPLAMGQVNERLQVHMVVTILPGGRAHARGLEFGTISPKLGEAFWEVTTFENEYAKGTDGKWRIAAAHLFPLLRSDYYQGWAKHWETPPAATPAFSYPHPVTVKAAAAAMETKNDNIEARIDNASLALERSRAWDAIENISSALNNYLDDFQWDAYADLMAVDAWKPRADGFYIGRDHIYRSIAQAYMAGPSPTSVRDTIREHIRTQPVIHISADGMKGQDRTRLFQIVIAPTSCARGGAMFVSGMYEDDIVFEDGVWKIRRADIDHLIYMPYKTGWTGIKEGAGTRAAPPMGAVAGEKYDAWDTGDIGAAYPKLPHMWFHYVNPVSGRTPRYLMPKYVLPEP